MAPVRRLVLDVLKPHDPPLPEFAERVSETEAVDGVSVSLVELDREVQNVALTAVGESLDADAVESTVEELGGTVHSVDLVACGDRVDPIRPTPRDS
ncbi:DUF211 domain-containing protein [Haloarcula marina]|uniref:DUF211 domain-containing protein n=1 Tax=Haloarcula marina TaxID=2961574 RepID=UPI0020B71661|nr:DUF211 domain-containing protein [Halomicroarcula marina]